MATYTARDWTKDPISEKQTRAIKRALSKRNLAIISEDPEGDWWQEVADRLKADPATFDPSHLTKGEASDVIGYLKYNVVETCSMVANAERNAERARRM